MSTKSLDRRPFVDRKKALIDADVSQAEIAREAQVSGALVHQVLLGDRKSPRVVAALKVKLGADVVAQLWPNVETVALAPNGDTNANVAPNAEPVKSAEANTPDAD